MHDNPEILGHTFSKAMPPINIQFRVAGLVPENRDVFEIVISCEQRQEIVLTSEQCHTRIKNCLFIG